MRHFSHLFSGICCCVEEPPGAVPSSGLPRRRLAAFAAAAVTGIATAQAQTPAARTRLVTLGIAAGRSAWRGSGVGSFSNAVVVGKDVYLLDFGKGWSRHFFEAGLGAPGKPGSSGGFESIRAGFLTHLHADHIVDLPELVLYGATDGLPKRPQPVHLYGPGPGLLPNTANFSASRPLNPANPVPGTEQMLESLFAAFAADLNDNIFDSGMPNPHQYIVAHDVMVPEGTRLVQDQPPPAMKPFAVYQDENIKVSAILVDHGAMIPSFGYRFETTDGVIAFSGDTTTCPNVVEIARGADILVHEVLDLRWANSLYPTPMTDAQRAKVHHLTHAHMPVQEVGAIAEAAGVKQLVLSHLAPFDLPEQEWLREVKNFRGKVIVARPAMSFELPAS